MNPHLYYQSSAAIYFQIEAYATSGDRLMGRNAAGESFLRGFFSYSKSESFYTQVTKPEHALDFESKLKLSGRSEPVVAVTNRNLSRLSEAGTLYFPGPNIGPQAFQRTAYGSTSWSLCGITHTTSSAGAMDSLAELLTAPVEPWDSIICTSTAVKDNVQRLLQAQTEYLKHRLGITKLVLPMFPVIPLGIHTKDFEYSEAQKAKARASIGADENTLVVLYMGRLSFHAKAHPLAMYQALEAAAQHCGKQVVLVECGWHANDFIQKAYEQASKLVSPSVRVVTLEGRKAENRETAWASADVFCSLSDNIQETFGITPIEAMAAGLPVVVSDWDGYKDTVRHGIDGYRVATAMPDAGLGGDLALSHALEVDTYDIYCGNTCSLVSVDVEQTTKAFLELFNSKALRHKMGQAGKQRAKEVYDWSVIIPQYEALWAKQTEVRLAAKASAQTLKHPWPARMDPFHAFASYPTQTIKPDTVLRLNGSLKESQDRLSAYLELDMVKFAKRVIPSKEEVEAVLSQASKGQCTAHELVQGIQPARRAQVFRALAWLLKLNILQIAASGQ